MCEWPPLDETKRHGATYEWDGPNAAVRCECGFYRIAESHAAAEREYINHIDSPRWSGGVSSTSGGA